MASTEQRAGFRLPWTGSAPAQETVEEGQSEESQEGVEAQPESVAEAVAETEPATDGGAQTDEAEASLPAMNEPTPQEESHMSLGAVEAPSQDQPATPEGLDSPAAPGARKPSKFLAELVRAMRAAAEDSRTQTLESFRVEAKTFVEGIHTRSADEATELRRIADDDIAGIREWSKAEIARVRAETEDRISERKGELEQHVEDHAALIEREIEMVQGCVAGFERDMEQFFARLNDIDDPAVFASAAQHLPEPPSLERADSEARSQALTDLVRGARSASPTATTPEAETVAPSDVAEPVAAIESPESPESPESAEVVEPAEWSAPTESTEPHDEQAVEATAEAAVESTDESPSAETVAETEALVEQATELEPATDDVSDSVAVSIDAEQDPRLTALGLTGDLAIAETEAAVDAASDDADGVNIENIDEDSLAARLAGLVPSSDAPASGRPAAAQADADAVTTQVVVVGLVSVASIASFKRHLGRVPGVHSVGVSSGPDGEFVFKASHEPSVALRDVVTTLPGFGARVVDSSDGMLNVSARDPEADS
jgi:hypothetical protein